MTSASDLALYDPFENLRFGPEYCFLSGVPVGLDDTVPVFAPWLQARYDLAGRSLQLLDQRTVLMSELRLPLRPDLHARIEEVEQAVARAAEVGPEGLRALPPETLFFWLGKMFYGIFVTELLNERDPLIKPRYPLAENVALLRRFQTFYQLLQGLRVPVEYADFVPASVFVLEVDQAYEQPEFEYDDDLNTLVFSMKLGRAVVVACLVDTGLIAQVMGKVYDDARRPLHPAQVAEFKARVYYGAHLLHVVPDIYPRPVRPGDEQLVLDVLFDDVNISIFNPWENPAYAQALADLTHRWGFTYTSLTRDRSEPLSLLYDENGQPRPANELPLPAHS